MVREFARDLADRAGERRAWTAIAALTFAAGGFVATLPGSLFIAAVSLDEAGSVSTWLSSVDPVLVGGVLLWFAAPVIGAVLTGMVPWVLLGEYLGTHLAEGEENLGWIAYPGFGGLSGVISGALAHVVMWLILAGAWQLLELVTGPVGVGEVGAAIGAWLSAGLFLGIASIFATGWVTVPILGLTGLVLGVARQYVTLGTPAAPEAEWHRDPSSESFRERA